MPLAYHLRPGDASEEIQPRETRQGEGLRKAVLAIQVKIHYWVWNLQTVTGPLSRYDLYPVTLLVTADDSVLPDYPPSWRWHWP